MKKISINLVTTIGMIYFIFLVCNGFILDPLKWGGDWRIAMAFTMVTGAFFAALGTAMESDLMKGKK